MPLVSFFLSDVVSSFAYEKLETMPLEDAGEREEKQRNEPSQLSSLWGDTGSTESEIASRVRSTCGMLEAERTGGLGPSGSVPAPQAGVHPRSGHTRQVSV
jgi:hypothetical protein